MKMLRQKGSGHLYVWTPQLAKRDDMVEVETEKPIVKVQTTAEIHATSKLVETTTGPADDLISLSDTISIKLN